MDANAVKLLIEAETSTTAWHAIAKGLASSQLASWLARNPTQNLQATLTDTPFKGVQRTAPHGKGTGTVIWRARFSLNSKTRVISGFETSRDAAMIRDAAFILTHEDYKATNLNFPLGPPSFPLSVADFLAKMLIACSAQKHKRERHDLSASLSVVPNEREGEVSSSSSSSSSSSQSSDSCEGVKLSPATTKSANMATTKRVRQTTANLVRGPEPPPAKRPRRVQAGVTAMEWLSLPPNQVPFDLYRTSGLPQLCRDLGVPQRPRSDFGLSRADVVRRIQCHLEAQWASRTTTAATNTTAATATTTTNHNAAATTTTADGDNDHHGGNVVGEVMENIGGSFPIAPPVPPSPAIIPAVVLAATTVAATAPSSHLSTAFATARHSGAQTTVAAATATSSLSSSSAAISVPVTAAAAAASAATPCRDTTLPFEVAAAAAAAATAAAAAATAATAATAPPQPNTAVRLIPGDNAASVLPQEEHEGQERHPSLASPLPRSPQQHQRQRPQPLQVHVDLLQGDSFPLPLNPNTVPPTCAPAATLALPPQLHVVAATEMLQGCKDGGGCAVFETHPSPALTAPAPVTATVTAAATATPPFGSPESQCSSSSRSSSSSSSHNAVTVVAGKVTEYPSVPLVLPIVEMPPLNHAPPTPAAASAPASAAAAASATAAAASSFASSSLSLLDAALLDAADQLLQPSEHQQQQQQQQQHAPSQQQQQQQQLQLPPQDRQQLDHQFESGTEAHHLLPDPFETSLPSTNNLPGPVQQQLEQQEQEQQGDATTEENMAAQSLASMATEPEQQAATTDYGNGNGCAAAAAAASGGGGGGGGGLGAEAALIGAGGAGAATGTSTATPLTPLAAAGAGGGGGTGGSIENQHLEPFVYPEIWLSQDAFAQTGSGGGMIPGNASSFGLGFLLANLDLPPEGPYR